MIEHYPDKFVFRNPGCLLVSVEQYFEGGTSICRNSILQKMFEFIGEGERAGSGVDTIKKGWASNKWPEPTIRELYDPEQVELTLFIGGTTQKTTIQDQILNLVRNNPTITTTEMAESLGLTRDGVNYHFNKMRGVTLERKNGDKGGHWEIIKGYVTTNG